MIGIILGIVIGIVLFIIGKCSATEPMPECCYKCANTRGHNCLAFSPFCCDHYGIGTLKTEIEVLKRTGDEMRKKIYFLEENSHPRICARNQMPCDKCEYRVYARAIDEQEIVKIILKSQKTAEQLVKDLNIKL